MDKLYFVPKKIWEGCVQKLYDAFWRLLEEKPYAQISVSELLARADVSRGDFYYHYRNLADLAKEAVEAEAKNWDDLTSLFLNFEERDIEVAADQICYYMTSVCRQNSVKARRLSVLISPHGSMYLVEAFREGFKEYIAKYRGIALKNFPICRRSCSKGWWALPPPSSCTSTF